MKVVVRLQNCIKSASHNQFLDLKKSLVSMAVLTASQYSTNIL